MRLFILLSFLYATTCSALDKAPVILRVCLDDNTAIATLYLSNSIDPCNSFKRFKVFSSENGGAFKLAVTETNINNTAIPVLLSDITSDWKFKIVAYYDCNGIDSFTSLEQIIDKISPPLSEIDSVSFDLITQNLSVGWKKNLAYDLKGYRIYSYNNSVSTKIEDVDTVTKKVLATYNSSNPIKITIAPFDSCDHFGIISSEQQSAYLDGNIDTCLRQITMNWTKYLGWSNTIQNLYLNKNGLGFYKAATLNANSVSEVISGIILGDKVCYFIQTEEFLLKKTSSSNTVCFDTRKLKTPNINYLSNVTVENDSYIKVSFLSDPYADTDSIILEKAISGSGNFQPFKKYKNNISKSQYDENDINTDITKSTYSYRVITLDKCHNQSSTSNIGRSILLSKPLFTIDSYVFNWNLFSVWENGIEKQLIEISTDRFTWNTYKTESPSATNIIYPNSTLESDSLCFRITDIENLNNQGFSSLSLSNIQCIYSVSDFYFPTALNPYSNNNVFRIYGLGYDKSRGLMEIFNRWGEKIFSTPNLETGWNASYNGEFVDMGNYVYMVTFYDELNKFYVRKGTIMIIK